MSYITSVINFLHGTAQEENLVWSTGNMLPHSESAGYLFLVGTETADYGGTYPCGPLHIV